MLCAALQQKLWCLGVEPYDRESPKSWCVASLLYMLLSRTEDHSGSRVKMSGHRLHEQSVSVPESTVLAACYWKNQDSDDLELVGHAFATVWDYNGGKHCFVLQYV